MELSTRLRPADDPLPPPGRLVITGAAGRIGQVADAHFRDRYPVVPCDVELPAHAPAPDRWRRLDITEAGALADLLAPGDTVLHLAATPDAGADWPTVRELNIEGTWQVLAAAAERQARRVILASSIHAVSGHPQDVQIRTDDPVAPGDLYGVSKCCVEALGHFIAVQRGCPVIAVRIGAFEPPAEIDDPDALGSAGLFVSPRDLMQLFERAVLDRQVQFAIVHGVSGNRFNRLALASTRQLLGYQPQDDFTTHHPRFADIDLWEAIPAHSDSRR